MMGVVRGLGQLIAHAHGGADHISAAAQMRHFAQLFQGDTALLQHIALIRIPKDFDRNSFDLKRLPLPRGGHQFTFDLERGPRIGLGNLVVVAQLLIGYHLDPLELRTIINFEKTKSALTVTARAQPTADGHGRADLALLEVFDQCSWCKIHVLFPFVIPIVQSYSCVASSGLQSS